MADRRARARPELSKADTRLAKRRLDARYTQKDMARLTGISLITYRRLERAEIHNPPLRHLVNCWLVLRVKTPELRLADVLEREWLTWLQLDPAAPGPPEPETHNPLPPLFPD